MDGGLLQCNASARIRGRDAWMLIAMWMEHDPTPSDSDTRRTGCIVVNPQEKIVSLAASGHSHAIVRALMQSHEMKGCDVYVSRLPCALCVKLMVQAGIRKCYYFPSQLPEWSSTVPVNHALVSGFETNDKMVAALRRLVSNNPIAMSLYIPQWDHREENLSIFKHLNIEPKLWEIDHSISTLPSITSRWPTIISKFNRTLLAIQALIERYSAPICSQSLKEEELIEGPSITCPKRIMHAIILCQIAAKRTDDPKVGVGSVIIENDQYCSVGWNGYPKKSQHLDYPQAGADDLVADTELKYEYILHAEQNALLYRTPMGRQFTKDTILVSTKMPCDECSPMIADLGIQNVYTNRQVMKKSNDPLKARGLSYQKVHRLIKNVFVFDTIAISRPESTVSSPERP